MHSIMAVGQTRTHRTTVLLGCQCTPFHAKIVDSILACSVSAQMPAPRTCERQRTVEPRCPLNSPSVLMLTLPLRVPAQSPRRARTSSPTSRFFSGTPLCPRVNCARCRTSHPVLPSCSTHCSSVSFRLVFRTARLFRAPCDVRRLLSNHRSAQLAHALDPVGSPMPLITVLAGPTTSVSARRRARPADPRARPP